MPDVRPPAVAGQFYAGTESKIQKQIKECYTDNYGPGTLPETKAGPRNILGLVSPHAGYPYSGPVAAHGFSKLAEDGIPETVILIGPAHRRRQGIFTDSHSSWETPLNKTEVDLELVKEISLRGDFVQENSAAHSREHSLEVQLPFLQNLFSSDFMIAPIIMGLNEMDLETSIKLSDLIGNIINELGRDFLILASSDFIHYGMSYGYTPVSGDFSEVLEWMRKTDGKTIDKIKELDIEGFYRILDKYDSTTCGYGPIAVAMNIVKDFNVNSKLLKYSTSGEITGREEVTQIVGYSSIIFKEKDGGD